MINRILLYNSGGGIGDALQILPLISALRNEFKNANFSYLCAHENHFNSSLKDLNRHINTLNLNIKYFGFRWWHFLILKRRIKKYKINKFDLVIDLQSKIRNSLILKMIPHKYFISPCFNFKFSKPALNIKKMNKINDSILDAVNNLFNIQSHETVHQMVSEVSGELNDNVNEMKIIQALFPGGSVTGAPKESAMKIIDRIENYNRNIYTGSIGYIKNNGDMNFNIPIRTMTIQNNIATYPVGGGIVWDSTSKEEWDEAQLKSKILQDFIN